MNKLTKDSKLKKDVQKEKKSSTKSTYILAILFFIFLLLPLLLFLFTEIDPLNLKSNEKATQTPNVQEETSDSSECVIWEESLDVSINKFTVKAEENSTDSTQTDIYIKEKSAEEENFLITLDNVYSNHYHFGEYHNGNLYLVHRIGYDGYPDEDWIDELWRYDENEEKVKLYSSQGIDFRVSSNEELIAVISNKELHILDNSGEILKSFNEEELVVDPQVSPQFSFTDIVWGNDSIWIDNTFGPSPSAILKINLKDCSIIAFDLSELEIGVEYSINSKREAIAFSDYPALFDEYSYEDFINTEWPVTLRVYDFNTKEQIEIATYTAQDFNPKWIDENTIEYNAPDGEERIKEQVFEYN